MEIKWIFFDIGGVVTFTDFQSIYKNFADKAGLSQEFIASYHNDNWDDLILGNISLEQFFDVFKKAGAIKGLDLKKIWVEEALDNRKINSELLNLIAKLRERYKVGVLSNLTFSRLILDEQMNIFKNFDLNVLSCIEHLKKPDPKFYNLALKLAGTSADETVFIDDKERNTLVAKALGFYDILYKNNEQLIADLKNFGI